MLWCSTKFSDYGTATVEDNSLEVIHGDFPCQKLSYLFSVQAACEELYLFYLFAIQRAMFLIHTSVLNPHRTTRYLSLRWRLLVLAFFCDTQWEKIIHTEKCTRVGNYSFDGK